MWVLRRHYSHTTRGSCGGGHYRRCSRRRGGNCCNCGCGWSFRLQPPRIQLPVLHQLFRFTTIMMMIVMISSYHHPSMVQALISSSSRHISNLMMIRRYNNNNHHHHHHHHDPHRWNHPRPHLFRVHKYSSSSQERTIISLSSSTDTVSYNQFDEISSSSSSTGFDRKRRYTKPKTPASLPPPPNITMVDSPAFVVLHYYRKKVNEDGSDTPHNMENDDEEEEVQERQRIMEKMKERQQHPNKQRYVPPKDPSQMKPSKFIVRRSFVGHPSFRYMTTVQRGRNNNNNNDVMDAVIERMEPNPTASPEDPMTTTTTTNDPQQQQQQKVYEELKSVAELIRQQDEIYYNNNNNNHPNPIRSAEDMTTKPGTYIQLQPYPQPISDAEYDALVALEEQLCRQYPDIYHRIQQESIYGNQVTRYNGRVGIAPDSAMSASLAIPTTGTTTTTTSDPMTSTTVSYFPTNEMDPDDNDDDDRWNPVDDGMTIAKMKDNEIEVAAATAVAATTVTSSKRSLSATQPPSMMVARTKQTHLRPMLSLDNVNDTTQLMQWLGRIRKKIQQAMIADQINLDDTVGDDDDDIVESTMPFTVTIITEPKLDGLSLNLRYALVVYDNNNSNDGTNMAEYQLQYASTRGDGKKGTDVTAAVRDGMISSSSIPYSFPVPSSVSTSTVYHFWPSTLEVRGEVVLPQSVFQQIQREQQQQLENDTDGMTSSGTMPFFSNARNAASGILLRKEASSLLNGDNNNSNSNTNDLRSKLRFYAYDIIVDNPDRLVTMTPMGGSIRELLRIFGFSVPQPCVSTTLTVPPARKTVVTKTEDSEDTDDDMDQTNNDTDNVDSQQWTESDISNMLQYYEDLRKYREHMNSNNSNNDASTTEKSIRGKLATATLYEWGDYDMDGCVHKVLDESVRVLLGSSTRAPRWAVAHKFPPTIAITELMNIEIQVGRTGALTPVAILKPVDIDGVTVQRATMHNFNHMQQILGHPNRVINGTKVLVRRAGEVIPQVMSRVFPMTDAELLLLELDPTKSISIQLPTHCPSCGSKAVGDNKDDDPVVTSPTTSSAKGTVLRCSGPSILCPPRAVAALQHAFSRDAFDITGLSEARIEQLIQTGYLHVPSDLFQLVNDETKLAEVAKIPGWGRKSVQNLATVAKKVSSDGITLSRFIYSLGIRGSGVHSSNLIASVYGNVDSFLNDLNDAAEKAQNVESDDGTDQPLTGFARLQEDNESTKGIGPILIAALHDFAKEKVLVDATRQLADCVKVLQSDSLALPIDVNNAKERPLSGLSVVFTGSIADLSRSEAQKIAKELGAKSTPASVSKSTGLVVSGEAGGKKLLQAHKLGVRVMNAEEFLNMVEEYRQSK